MCLLHMVIQIRQLRKGPLAVVTLVGLLTRVNRPHMNLQATLLRKDLITHLTGVLRKVRVPVIDNQALLLHRDLLPTVGHPTTPCGAHHLKRKVGCARC